MNKLLKDMILEAMHKCGGVDYLVRQAEDNPVAFLSLVGKILPMQVTGQDGGAITFKIITCVPTPEAIENKAAEDAIPTPVLGIVTVPENV